MYKITITLYPNKTDEKEIVKANPLKIAQYLRIKIRRTRLGQKAKELYDDKHRAVFKERRKPQNYKDLPFS